MTQLFSSTKPTDDAARISVLVNHRHDRKAAAIAPLTVDEKMLCALRKVLAAMTDDARGVQRFYIDGPECVVTHRSGTGGSKPGEPGSYSAAGRFRMGIITNDGTQHKVVAFVINFRDTKDDRGLADVAYFDPTTLDDLGPDAKL
jgi:hypothetical protein